MLTAMLRAAVIILLIPLVGCNQDIYLRDGTYDGDTFTLSPRALVDDDPVLQSWVAYSLTRSACQLQIGGNNPARASSYGCEFSARQHLLDTWEEKLMRDPAPDDPYLEALLAVRRAGFLDEYTVYYFAETDWQVPIEVDVAAFRDWQHEHLRRHRPQTRMIGFWSYGDESQRRN